MGLQQNEEYFEFYISIHLKMEQSQNNMGMNFLIWSLTVSAVACTLTSLKVLVEKTFFIAFLSIKAPLKI